MPTDHKPPCSGSHRHGGLFLKTLGRQGFLVWTVPRERSSAEGWGGELLPAWRSTLVKAVNVFTDAFRDDALLVPPSKSGGAGQAGTVGRWWVDRGLKLSAGSG